MEELSLAFGLELLAMNGDNYNSTYPNGVGMNEFYTDDWSCNFLHESLESSTTSTNHPMSMASDFSIPQMKPFFDVPFNQVYNTLDVTSFAAPATSIADHITASKNIIPHFQDQYVPMMSDEKFFFLTNGIQHMEEDKYVTDCKLETLMCTIENQGHDKSVVIGEQRRNNGVKKVGGQPSKNLMAERRRRKRLNDRLSMLRSIVPRISKMDRTSILADTIGYMKELLEKIAKFEEEKKTEADVIKNLKGLKSNELQTKHSPKFDVKVGEKDTRVNITCTLGQGLLLSTLNSMEELGLEIQQCVASCFNDFSMQAACSQSQVSKDLPAEEIMQALFKKAGYDDGCEML